MGGRKVRAAARSKYRDEKDRASSWSAIFVGKADLLAPWDHSGH